MYYIKITTNITRRYLPRCFDLYHRPSLEVACSVLLTILAMVVMRRGKKSVVCVAQCVAALVPVHRILDTESDRRNQGGTMFYEPRQGQLHTEPHIRPISCHVASLPGHELEEELNTLFLSKVSDRDRSVSVSIVRL